MRNFLPDKFPPNTSFNSILAFDAVIFCYWRREIVHKSFIIQNASKNNRFERCQQLVPVFRKYFYLTRSCGFWSRRIGEKGKEKKFRTESSTWALKKIFFWILNSRFVALRFWMYIHFHFLSLGLSSHFFHLFCICSGYMNAKTLLRSFIPTRD